MIASLVKKYAVLVAALLTVAILSACQTAEGVLKASGQQPLNTSELKELFTGNTIFANNVEGQEWDEYHARDGKLYAVGGKREGTWWISDDGKFCLTVRDWSRGVKRCQSIYKSGGGYVAYWSDGAKYMDFTVVPGNPNQLGPQ